MKLNKINTNWQKLEQDKLLMRRNNMSDNLVVGHELIDLFQKSSDYFVGFGKPEDKLVALLPVEDMASNGYYSTGEGFVAVFLLNNGQRYVGDTNFAMLPEYQKFKEEHPVVLYFLGRDDGSYGKQFKTNEDALEFLKNIESLDNMVNSHDGNSIYEMFRKKKEMMTTDELNEVFKNSLLYIN